MITWSIMPVNAEPREWPRVHDDSIGSGYSEAAQTIKAHLEGAGPGIALVLGSGLGALAEGIVDPVVVPYSELAGFRQPTVPGHSGRLLIGDLDGVGVACLQGRFHAYEGYSGADIAVPVRALREIGCHTLILTNAAGSLRRSMGPGSLMMITDHINWAGVNPLFGPNGDVLGPRFCDMTQAYDPQLQRKLRSAAMAAGIPLFEGVYLMYPGPSFETPAEIRAFAALGADATGMSTVPETLVAKHCGMRVAAISVITNLAAGIGERGLSHEQTLASAVAASDRLARLLSRFLVSIAP